MHLHYGPRRFVKMPKLSFKNIFRLLALAILCSCSFSDHSGFYNPITLKMTVPDGPPEYKAGWYAGCKTGGSMGNFANNWVYRKGSPDFGSGVYQHDSVYQTGWGQGYYACSVHIANFLKFFPSQNAPLD